MGLFCNRTFDRYACWPDTPAGSVVNISCPFYLPWYDKGKSHNYIVWTNKQDLNIRQLLELKSVHMLTLYYFLFFSSAFCNDKLYTVGYSLSYRHIQEIIVSPLVSHGVVRRRCGSDGHWEKESNGQVWRDMTQCEEEKEVVSQEVWQPTQVSSYPLCSVHCTTECFFQGHHVWNSTATDHCTLWVWM